MSKNIISSLHSFSSKFELPQGKDALQRTEALKKYFARGGVISAVKNSKSSWPKLIYPSPPRIDSQLKELEVLHSLLEKKQKEWKGKLSDAKSYHSRHQMLKFSEPLYWRHMAKSFTDKDYKEDSQKVSLPVHLSADPRWKPMINMFLSDTEYRKNLVETVQTSIVYKDDKRVAKYADVLQDLRSDISTSKLEDLDEKLAKLKDEIEALKTIKKWAQE
ncbi:MAG TPA: hypothetical protein VJG83_05545 [archaeon]|nr:hypothetical protein [archaeon]